MADRTSLTYMVIGLNLGRSQIHHPPVLFARYVHIMAAKLWGEKKVGEF